MLLLPCSLMAIIPAVVKGDSCSDFMMGPATTLASTATALIQAYNEVEVTAAATAAADPCSVGLRQQLCSRHQHID